jgi:hypothetical protein
MNRGALGWFSIFSKFSSIGQNIEYEKNSLKMYLTQNKNYEKIWAHFWYC